MSIHVIRCKNRQEWLKARQAGIGSSEVATILGVNPYETPYQLWRRKKGLDAPKEENFFMKAGHYLEEAVAKFYADETGVEIIKRSAEDFLIVNDSRDYLRVSPDRTFWLPNMPHSNDNKGIVECKTTQMSIDEDSIPQHWFCQLQYQLGTAEMYQGALAWLTQGREFGYKNYDLDRDFYGFMLEECDKFYIDYIIGKAEPPSISEEDVMLRSPRSAAGKSVEATEEFSDLVVKLFEAKDAESKASELVDKLTEKIKLFMGDAESLTYRGITLATWKSGKDSSKFDATKYAADHPELVKSYMKTAPGQRRFLLKTKK